MMYTNEHTIIIIIIWSDIDVGVIGILLTRSFFLIWFLYRQPTPCAKLLPDMDIAVKCGNFFYWKFIFF